MESSFLSLQCFLHFFIWSVNYSRDFSVTLSVSKLYELSLWIMELISEISSNISINLYLTPCSIAIYGKFYLYCLYHFRLFLACKNLVHELCITFLLLFKLFLLASKLYDSSQNFFSDMLKIWTKVYIWELLVLLLIESSIPTFQYFFSIFHLVCKFLKSLFLSFFCWSANCMSWVFES